MAEITPKQAYWMLRNAYDYIEGQSKLVGHKEPQRKRAEEGLKLLMNSLEAFKSA